MSFGTEIYDENEKEPNYRIRFPPNNPDETIKLRNALGREISHPPQQTLDEIGQPDDLQPQVISSYKGLAEIPSSDTVVGQIASREIEALATENHTRLSSKSGSSFAREKNESYEQSPLEQAQDQLTPLPKQPRHYDKPRLFHHRF